MNDELLVLAERCEKAEGPDRELDIAMLPLVGLRFVDEGHPIGQVCYDRNNHGVPMPRFTASLDAAMTLVPEGCKVVIEIASYQRAAWVYREGESVRSAFAQTAPLALCAAALRSKAKDHSGGGE